MKKAIPTLLLSSALLAGCSLSGAIISHKFNAAASVKGDAPKEIVLPVTNTKSYMVEIEDKQLSTSTEYKFDEGTMSLKINGDFPANSSLNMTGGQLHITGDIKGNTHINIDVPNNSHAVRSIATGRLDHYEVEVLPPYDKEPVLVVDGNVDKTAVITVTDTTTVEVKGYYSGKFKAPKP